MFVPSSVCSGLILLSYFTVLPLAYAANDCDCSVVVGKCLGAVEFIKGYGSNKNYGAEIMVHSSELSCSKVDYYVDNTPYSTILKNKTSGVESLFGTSPIKSKNITFSTCSVCKKKQSDTSNGNPASRAMKDIDKFVGTWSGERKTSLGFSASQSILVEKLSDDTVNMAITVGRDNYQGRGKVQGNILTFGIFGGCDGTMKLITQNIANYQCSLGIFSSSGQMKK